MQPYRITCLALALTSLAGAARADVYEEMKTLLDDGLRAINRYDFKSGVPLLEKYKALAKKVGDSQDWRVDEALAGIPMAEDMLAGRVEKIVVVDSITVPKNDFFKAYRLARPAGSLIPVPADLSEMGEKWAELNAIPPIYESEDGTVRYVSEETEKEDEEFGTVFIARTYEGFRLEDGSWSDPEPVFDEDVDASFPFMLNDGCTFYFASNSEPGLGGYDIFRSYRDSETGEFQNPVNMGLPYNSPADDYMLAIDEYTGAGWWATERNPQTDEEGNRLVTIYVFVPSEMRENYDADTPGLKNLAALWPLHFPQETALDDDDDAASRPGATSAVPGWKLTWPDGADYSDLLGDIQAIGGAGDEQPVEFRFVGDKGRVYTRYSQLPRMAIAPMQRYVEQREQLDSAEANMLSLRRKYHAVPTDALRSEINAAQNHLDRLRKEVRQSRNSVFQALRSE